MRLDGFGLLVKDMPATVRFYLVVPGFEITERNLIEIGSFNRPFRKQAEFQVQNS